MIKNIKLVREAWLRLNEPLTRWLQVVQVGALARRLRGEN